MVYASHLYHSGLPFLELDDVEGSVILLRGKPHQGEVIFHEVADEALDRNGVGDDAYIVSRFLHQDPLPSVDNATLYLLYAFSARHAMSMGLEAPGDEEFRVDRFDLLH
jgi:hypothetical protein